MSVPERRKLEPMGAIEFAIDKAFRHFFFSIGLVLAWGLLLSPLIAAAWYFAFRNGLPQDMAALAMPAKVALGVLAAGALLASFSIAVNWHRRVLTGVPPRGLGWVTLGGAVWRLVLGHVLLLAVLALYAGVIFAILTKGIPAFEPQLGPAVKPAAIALAVLFGLSALFTFYRMWNWLAGIAVGDRGYGLGTAWRRTRGNRIAYLFFTFWLLFTLAIGGGIGAGAFFGQKMLANPWVSAAAFGLMGLAGWITVFIVASIPASHYQQFRDEAKTAQDTIKD